MRGEDGLDTLVIQEFSDLDIKQSGDDTVVNGPSDAFSIVIRGFAALLLAALASGNPYEENYGLAHGEPGADHIRGF